MAALVVDHPAPLELIAYAAEYGAPQGIGIRGVVATKSDRRLVGKHRILVKDISRSHQQLDAAVKAIAGGHVKGRVIVDLGVERRVEIIVAGKEIIRNVSEHGPAYPR